MPGMTRARVRKLANHLLACLERRAGRSEVRSLPSELILETTTRCNLRCAMCFRQHLATDLNVLPDMEPAVLDRVVREFFPTATIVSFAMTGEPLLTGHLEFLADACRRHGVGVSLVTNGTLLDQPGLAERLAPVLRGVEVSVDTTDPARFAALRGGANLDAVLRGFAGLQKAMDLRRGHQRWQAGLSVTLTPGTVDELPRLVELAHRMGASFVRARRQVVFRDGVAEGETELPDSYAAIHARTCTVARRFGIRLQIPGVSTTFRGQVRGKSAVAASGRREHMDRRGCTYLYRTVHIDRRGCLEPCVYHSPPLLAAGIAATRTDWQRGAMASLRRQHAAGRLCSQCQECYLR